MLSVEFSAELPTSVPSIAIARNGHSLCGSFDDDIDGVLHRLVIGVNYIPQLVKRRVELLVKA